MPTENLRFRETSLVFKVAETAAEEEVKKMCRYQYPNMCKSMGDFTLNITEGEFTDSEIMVMLGENGEREREKWAGSESLYVHGAVEEFWGVRRTNSGEFHDVLKQLSLNKYFCL